MKNDSFIDQVNKANIIFYHVVLIIELHKNCVKINHSKTFLEGYSLR